MKGLALLTISMLTAFALFACSTCPVPPSAPRTYSLHTPQGSSAQK